MGDGVEPRWRSVARIAALVALTLIVAPSAARADWGDRSVAIEAAGSYPWGGRAMLFVQEGIGDWLSVRVGAGANFNETAAEAIGSFGLVAAFDVFAWVPELYLGVGGAVGDPGIRARLCARVAMRTYLSFDWSLTFGVGGEWTPDDDWLALAGVGVWWQL